MIRFVSSHGRRAGILAAGIPAAVLLAGSPALAQSAPAALDGVRSAALLNELLGLFVTATVLESALTTIFQWRLYREFFNGRAVKTLVMIVAGLAVVKGFDYDVFARVMAQAGGAGSSSATSQLLSAFILAGGSAAVYQLFVSLGFRAPVDAAQAAPKPAENLAWISVKIVRRRAVGPLQIHIEEVTQPSADGKASPPLAGVIGARPLRDRLRGIFFADAMRYPPYGGLTLKAGTIYRILAVGRRTGESGDGAIEAFGKEIFLGSFASRAVIDFVEDI